MLALEHFLVRCRQRSRGPIDHPAIGKGHDPPTRNAACCWRRFRSSAHRNRIMTVASRSLHPTTALSVNLNKVALVRMIVAEDTSRVASVLKKMIKEA